MSHKKSSKFSFIFVLVVALVIVLAFCVYLLPSDKDEEQQTSSIHTSDSHVIKHAQGETSIPVQPQKIAVFDIAALSLLDALQSQKIAGVAGTSSLPDYLNEYRSASYQALGTLFEPDYEAVNALQPDLVITGGRSSAKYKELTSIAPAIDMPVDNERPLQTAIENAKLIGSIIDKSEQANELIEHLNGTITEIKQKTAGQGNGLIVLVTGGKLSAYGAGSRFGIIHTDFGIPQAAEGLATTLHGEAISLEFIQKTNPDWLFVIDRDAAIGRQGAAKQVIENPLIKTTNAWKKDHIVYLDPTPWYLVGEGLVAVQHMADEINAVFSQESL